MSDTPTPLQGDDFAAGIALDRIPEGGMLLGHAFGEALLLSRHGGALFAVGATCTHYGGPLAEGLVVGDTVRCPWHHAAFSLRTGEAVRTFGQLFRLPYTAGIVALGLMWLRMVEAANAALDAGTGDAAFYEAKLVTARYFAERIMPEAGALRRKIEGGADAIMALSPEAFARG